MSEATSTGRQVRDGADHGITITEVHLPAGTPLRAECLCGWTSSNLPSRPQASAAGQAHIEDVRHIFDADPSVSPMGDIEPACPTWCYNDPATCGGDHSGKMLGASATGTTTPEMLAVVTVYPVVEAGNRAVCLHVGDDAEDVDEEVFLREQEARELVGNLLASLAVFEVAR